MIRSKSKGFTLIELIMVIVIVGVLSTMTTDIITLPVKSYIDLERRTTLVDTAEMVLKRMQRDIRSALPNSIRITGGATLELLHTTDGGRYRARLASDGSGDILDFTISDSSFDVLGSLSTVPIGDVVIYNLDAVSTGTAADPNAYDGDNRASIDNVLSTINKIVLNATKLFPFSSPQQRFFIVDTAISYQCTSGELRRFDNAIDAGYTIGSSIAGLNYKLQAKSESLSCSFSYDAGTATRGGLLKLEITLTDEFGESVKLINQVHVDNMP